MAEDQDHDCIASLSTNKNDIIIESGQVLVYRDCTECEDEFVTEYEYNETRPCETVDEEHDCLASLSTNENAVVVESGQVLVYRDCTKCGTEFVTEYEYSETRPA